VKSALLLALAKPKGKGSPPAMGGESESDGDESTDDYKQIAKDALKDGDFDAAVDALCSYIDGHEG